MVYGHKTQSFMKNGGQQKFLDKALDGLSKLVNFEQTWGILQTRMDQRKGYMKMNLFKYQNACYKHLEWKR